MPRESFEHHNLINLFEYESQKFIEKIGKFKEFCFYKSSYENSNYLYLKNGNEKTIAVCSYFFFEIDSENVPAIDLTVIDEDFRRIGICNFFYDYFLETYGKLISGNCLNKSFRKVDSSFGIWMKLSEKYEMKIFEVLSKKIIKYSYYKAFKSKWNYRRRLIVSKHF